jgi:hypothetical protein
MLTENSCLFSPNQTSDAQQLAVITTHHSVNARGGSAPKPRRFLILTLGGAAGLVSTLPFLPPEYS